MQEREEKDEKIKVPWLSFLSSWYSYDMYVISILELKKPRPESENFLKCHTVPDPVQQPPSPPATLSFACFLGLGHWLSGETHWASIPGGVGALGVLALGTASMMPLKEEPPLRRRSAWLSRGPASCHHPWAQMRRCTVGNAIWPLQQLPAQPGHTAQVCDSQCCRG